MEVFGNLVVVAGLREVNMVAMEQYLSLKGDLETIWRIDKKYGTIDSSQIKEDWAVGGLGKIRRSVKTNTVK